MKERSAAAKALTFLRFVSQQIARGGAVRRDLAARAAAPFAFEAPTLVLSGADASWRATGLRVAKGERFELSARGTVWLAKPLAVGVEPRVILWVRINGAEGLAKPVDDDHVFAAWADGEVEVALKSGADWASARGDLLPGKTPPLAGEVRVRVAATDRAPTPGTAPPAWNYLWRIGEGRIFTPGDDEAIAIDTSGDVGILQCAADHALTPATELAWSWRVDALPSRLREDLTVTHDYLSVACEFDDGRDLTYIWSAGLPHDHVFRCPLPFWCDWETHWVVRARGDPLGQWHDERRNIAADAMRAYGERPRRIVRLWLIANSVFQRFKGKALIRGLRLREGA